MYMYTQHDTCTMCTLCTCRYNMCGAVSSFCKSKVKSYYQLSCSRENVVRVTGRYVTRIVAAVVWCGVAWSLLGTSALPKQYFSDESCQLVSQNVTNDSNLPIDDTLYVLSSEFSILASFNDEDLNQYILLEIKTKPCENISLIQVENHNWSLLVLSDSMSVTVNDNINQGRGGLTDISDGHFFALILLLIFSSICGFIAKLMCLPPLFGMIIAGIILRNVPYIDFASHIEPAWSSTIRNIALVIILIRGGLSMKLKDLKRLKHAVLVLGSIPCVVEGVVDGAIAILYLKMPWQWGLMLG